MGVFIGQSTKIYDRETGEIHYGAYLLVLCIRQPCHLNVVNTAVCSDREKVDAKTRAKTSLNDLLRED